MSNLSTALTHFFEAEIRNEDAMRREAGAPGSDEYEATHDPESDLYVPAATLDSALDSWEQAPDDVRADWAEVSTERVNEVYNDLHDLIDNRGDGSALLTDLL